MIDIQRWVVLAMMAAALILGILWGWYAKPNVPACQEDEVITHAGFCWNLEQADFHDGYWWPK